MNTESERLTMLSPVSAIVRWPDCVCIECTPSLISPPIAGRGHHAGDMGLCIERQNLALQNLK